MKNSQGVNDNIIIINDNNRHDWVGKVIHCELRKKFLLNHKNKSYMHNPTSVLENDTHKVLYDFDIQKESLNFDQMSRSYNKQQQQKKRTCKIVVFAVPADHRLILKEREKNDNISTLLGDRKKLWNMKVTFIPIIIGALGTVIKGLIKRLEDLKIKRLVGTTQTTALLRSVRILSRFRET